MKYKIAFAVICIETAVICFFIFGFVFHINHYRARVNSFIPPRFSTESVYGILKLNDDQKTQFDSIVAEFKKTQRENQKKNFDNFTKLNKLITTKDADEAEIDRIKEKQCKIMEDSFMNSVDYLVKVKSILNDEQKEIFAQVMKTKQMYKIMPPYEYGNMYGRNFRHKGYMKYPLKHKGHKREFDHNPNITDENQSDSNKE